MKNPILLLPYRLRWFLATLTSAVVFSLVFGFMGLVMDFALLLRGQELYLTFKSPLIVSSEYYFYLFLPVGFLYGIAIIQLRGNDDLIVKGLKKLESEI